MDVDVLNGAKQNGHLPYQFQAQMLRKDTELGARRSVRDEESKKRKGAHR